MKSRARKAWIVAGLVAAGAWVPALAEERVLLDARTLAEWEFVTPEKTAALDGICLPQADGSLTFAGKPTGFVATKASYENYRLHVEWRWTEKPGNGGVLLHIASGPKDRAWPLSFQVQTKHKSVGDLLPMAGATFAEAITSAPGAAAARVRAGADSEQPAGEWNRADIVCRDGEISVTINGVAQNHVTGASLHSGRIGLQFEGAPFAVRAVRIESLPAAK